MDFDFKNFQSPSNGTCSFKKVVNGLACFVNEDLDSKYSIVVGSDSEQKNGFMESVSVIAIHRVGSGGRYFWAKKKGIKTYSLRDRMYKEALFSLDLAKKVIEALKDRISEDKYDFEIHVDIGQAGPTKEMIKEIVGMIRGNGFVAKIKPEAFGASNVADRYA